MIWTVILNVLLSWPSPVQQATVLSPAQDANKPQPHTPSDISQLRVKADSGDPDAENDLGVRYRMGEGVEKDKEEAVRWYRKAAKHGSAAAMFNLGAAYYNGDGVGVDDVVSHGSYWQKRRDTQVRTRQFAVLLPKARPVQSWLQKKSARCMKRGKNYQRTLVMH